jgi:dihydrofolate reductase
MRQVVVSEFVTIDGVFEDSGGVDGFAHGGWAFRYSRGPEGDQFKLDENLSADALLLGRRTYEGFAEAWSSRTDDSGFAQKMNSIPKCVASETLDRAGWNNSTILKGDLVHAIQGLIQEGDGTILVVGSGSIVRYLLEHDLADELRLMVFPTVLGSGGQLFAGVESPRDLTVMEIRPIGETALVSLGRARNEMTTPKKETVRTDWDEKGKKT